jgi:butyryl-CoA dehydrogenase
MYLDKKYEDFRKSIREFAEKEIEPQAHKIDESAEFPYENMKKVARLGLLGMVAPPDYGGTGIDTLKYAIAVEELSRVCGSTGITIAAHNSLAICPIYLFGNNRKINISPLWQKVKS